MIVLAVDTATKAASAALIDNGEIRSEFLINNRTMHSRNLMPLVEEAVKAAGIKKSDIDLFASTVGPGSFSDIYDFSGSVFHQINARQFRQCFQFFPYVKHLR
jgi:tRNA threonylcarbamoyladenosine biosynthesis protein TsaB